MKVRWKKTLFISLFGAACLMAAWAVVLSRFMNEPEFPLAEVLWIRDVAGVFHGPNEPQTKELLQTLQAKGLDIHKPQYARWVLMNLTPGKDDWFLLLNWRPPGSATNKVSAGH